MKNSMKNSNANSNANKFLVDHPSIVKTVIKSTPPQNKSTLTVSHQQIRSSMLSAQRDKIMALQQNLSDLTTQAKLAKESLVFYNPSIQQERYASLLAAAKDQLTYLNQQIANCQQVQHQTTPEQYYLWKKKQRVDTFDMAMGEMYMKIDSKKSQLLSKIQQNKAAVEQQAKQIEEMQELMESHPHEESSSVKFPINDSDIEALTSSNINLREEYNSQLSTLQILHENKEILTAQLVDGIESIEKSLLIYFQAEKIKLSKELKQIREDRHGKEVAPLTAEQQAYKVDPLIADYSHRLKQMQTHLSPALKSSLAPLLTPFPWQSFSFLDHMQAHSHSNVYDEYRQMEVKCMEQEVELKKLEEEQAQIDAQANSYQVKLGELGSALAKLSKMKK